MSETATAVEPPLKMADPPPATRIWVVIQKLSSARDGYTRTKDHDTRVTLAGDISDLVEQLRTLADTLVEEVSRPSD